MPDHAAVACVRVPVGWRVIVVSDLFLGASTDRGIRRRASIELAHLLEMAEGPGALVIAGNAFDLLVPAHGDPSAAVEAHVELRRALAGYLAADCERRALLLPGSRDRPCCTTRLRTTAVISAGFEVALQRRAARRHRGRAQAGPHRPGLAFRRP